MTYNNLGNAYGVKGSFEQAVAAYRKAVNLNPQYAEAWMNLGVTAIRAGEVGGRRRRIQAGSDSAAGG